MKEIILFMVLPEDPALPVGLWLQGSEIIMASVMVRRGRWERSLVFPCSVPVMLILMWSDGCKCNHLHCSAICMVVCLPIRLLRGKHTEPEGSTLNLWQTHRQI